MNIQQLQAKWEDLKPLFARPTVGAENRTLAKSEALGEWRKTVYGFLKSRDFGVLVWNDDFTQCTINNIWVFSAKEHKTDEFPSTTEEMGKTES